MRDEVNQAMTSDSLQHRQDEIRTFRKASPFVPFRVVLKDGRRFDVGDPLRIGFFDTIVAFVAPRNRRIEFKISEIDRLAPLERDAGNDHAEGN
jgi:hypothetical protein